MSEPAKKAPTKQEKAVSPAASNDAPRPQTDVAETPGTYVYIGPSIPRGNLKENTIFHGLRSDILAHLAPVVDQYPSIKTLIVSVDRLPEQRARLATGGNAISNTYHELSDALRKQ